MANHEKTLGKLELEVLKIIWDQQGRTVPAVADFLEEQNGYARTTTLTVIQRLHKKGFLRREKTKGIYHYYPTEAKQTVLGNLASQFVKNMFDGSSANLVQHLTHGEVPADELAQIRDIINEALESEEGSK
ncbi:MAG: BlaI/MecI/CopY family transcriptional regulator [Planctomycetes bacterium]|nr:BlaI/MecI/CopY family transcriptional regulator [Planctomycetota bacterium]